jgi:hypothetical protein
MKNYLLYFSVLFVFNCTTSKKNTPSTNNTNIQMAPTTTINQPTHSYTDGNGNLYTLYTTKLVYSPIKKEMSSSGYYSGGVAKTVNISNEQFTNIAKIITQAINNTNIHIEQRVMGSGIVTNFIDGAKNRSYKITQKAKEFIVLDAFMKDLFK